MHYNLAHKTFLFQYRNEYIFIKASITIDALYDYTLYVWGAYNGPYIRIKHHIYVRAYNHRITNGQRIIPSYD